MFEKLEAENGALDRRLRIAHAQHLSPSDIPRFCKLHVVASVEPCHAIDDGRWADKRIGFQRVKTTYAFRSLLDVGVVLAFGSDWFVAPMNPLARIYAAVTRRTLDGNAGIGCSRYRGRELLGEPVWIAAELGLAVTVIGGPFTITLSIKTGCALQASEPDRLEKAIRMGYAAGEAAACGRIEAE
jgi:hypothetical protein